MAWDNDADAWSAAGITTTDPGDGNIECDTTHLTVFTVLGIPIPTTTEVLMTSTEEGMTKGFVLCVILKFEILSYIVFCYAFN